MPDNIPFDIQVEIIKRLPIKCLLRFRSVSKPWKSLIGSSEFIAGYKVHHSQPQRLLVSYRDRVNSELNYVSIDDDATFPQRKCSLNVPMFFKSNKTLGCSHGLLCLYGYHQDGDDSSPNSGFLVVVLWNPSIRKSVVIKVPNELSFPYESVIGFGVCPNKNDPKIVKVNYIGFFSEWESISCIPFQVEVFTLSSRAWRIPCRNLPRKSIRFKCYHVVIDGFIYWMAVDRTVVDDHYKFYELIISFDLTSEEFREIYLPDYLAQSQEYLSISKLRDSLVLLECCYGERIVFGVWMMEHGVPNSFKKLFAVNAPGACLNTLLGFMENGDVMLETFDDDEYTASLEVYELCWEHIKKLGIYGEPGSFFVSSYMETLMLLDQPNCSIDSKALCYG